MSPGHRSEGVTEGEGATRSYYQLLQNIQKVRGYYSCVPFSRPLLPPLEGRRDRGIAQRV